MNVSTTVPTKSPLLFEKCILEQGDQISKKLHLSLDAALPSERQEGLAFLLARPRFPPISGFPKAI